jgi:hypothetical protein
LNVGDLLKEVEAALDGITKALALVDKFAVFLPAQYRTPLTELESVLTTVSDFVHKL